MCCDAPLTRPASVSLLTLVNALAFLMLLPVLFVLEGPALALEGWGAVQAVAPLALFSAVLLQLYQQTSYNILSRVSAVTHSVANVVKRVVVIVAAVIFFRHPVSLLNAVGTAMALGGVFLYSQVKLAEKQVAQKKKVRRGARTRLLYLTRRVRWKRRRRAKRLPQQRLVRLRQRLRAKRLMQQRRLSLQRRVWMLPRRTRRTYRIRRTHRSQAQSRVMRPPICLAGLSEARACTCNDSIFMKTRPQSARSGWPISVVGNQMSHKSREAQQPDSLTANFFIFVFSRLLLICCFHSLDGEETASISLRLCGR